MPDNQTLKTKANLIQQFKISSYFNVYYMYVNYCQ